MNGSGHPLVLVLPLTLVVCLVLLNTAGIPWYMNAGASYSVVGNDFGWPWMYLRTDFTQLQWEQTRIAGSSGGAPLTPLELTSVEWHIVKIDRLALLGNLLFTALVTLSCFYLAATISRYKRPASSIRWLMLVMALVAIFTVVSRSGAFYTWYWQYRDLFRLVCLLIMFSAMATVAIRFMSRRSGGLESPSTR